MEIAYQAWSETFGSELHQKDTDSPSIEELSPTSLDTESSSNDSAFHTPSFGDEDFSVENQLAQQKSAEEGSEPPAAQQVSISCTAQVALLQHPYSNSGYSPPQGYIATDSPTQLNTGPAYNSGTLQHHNTQANYPYPTAINRYPQYHSPPPPPQTLSQPQSGVGGSIGYNNSNNIVTTINSGVGSGYHPGSHLQASQHNQQQYYNSTGGYLSSLNSSPYINGGVNGGIYNNPQFPPQNYFDIPDINGDGSNLNYYNQQQLPSHLQHHYSSYIHPQQQHSSAINPAYIPTTYYNTGVMAQRDPILSTMDESRAMGYNMAGDKNSSEDSDDNVPLSKLSKGKVTKRKRGGGAANTRSGDKAGEGKKPRTPKKRRKKDPNEPVKPVSAYAMFFRDTQSAIKSENPKATFGEVSKIVASMWDGLEDEAKSEYKQRTEIAKKEYLQKLAVYKASLVSQGADGGSGSVESSPQVSPEKNIPTANNIQTTLQPPQPQLVQPTLNAPTVYQSPPHDSQPDQEQQEQTTTLVDEQQATQEDTVSSGSSNSPDQAIDQAPEMSSTVSPPHNSTVDSEECTDMVNTLPEEPMTNEPVQNNYDKEASAINTNMFYGKNEPPAASPTSVQCTRSGCERPPVDSPLWDSEYCSNQCVVDHCRDVFTAWVASRSGYASVN